MTARDDELRAQIASGLFRVLNKVQADSRSEHWFGEGVGLTMVEAEIIALIGQGHVIAVDIARELGVTQSAVSQVIRRLKDKGHVVAGRDETNARRRPLTLTKTGKSAARALAAHYQELGAALFSTSGVELEHNAAFVARLETFLDANRSR